MNLTKRIAAGAAALLSAVLLAVPAYAHGSGHHNYTQQSTQTTQTTTVQQPVQTVYSCGVAGCTVTGAHTHHNGVTHTAGYTCDGTCAALCTVEGCTVSGRHTHDGTTYCGYHHGSGYCDGSCIAPPAAVSHVSGGHHQNGHGHH